MQPYVTQVLGASINGSFFSKISQNIIIDLIYHDGFV
jgi:hypothetical protein